MQQAKKTFISFLPSETFIWILFILLIGISRSVDGNSTELLVENEKRREFLELEESFLKEDEIDDRRKEALEDLQKIFGIRVQSANNSIPHKTPPQFMMELYNTIADSNGVTRGKNPYNAKIVRSFVERDTRLSHLYLFNISGLENNESVIEAELHLFRKRSALKVINPMILRSPYYLIRVYQVLEDQSMDEPDAHRLLNVHYVGAYASGWQVFNVKQAVLAWIAGAPNLGLMVKASTLFGDEASIEFTRRNDYHHSKQPILVLFDDDGRMREETANKFDGVPHYYTYNDDQEDELIEDSTNNDNNDQPNSKQENENIDSELLDDYYSGSSVHRRKRQQDESKIKVTKTNGAVTGNKELNKEVDYGTQLENNLEAGKTEFFQRSKRIGRKQDLFDDDGRIREETTDKFDGVPYHYTYSDDQEDDTNNDNNNLPNFKEEDETIDSELLADYHSGSSVHRHKRQQDESEFKVTEANKAVNGNKELNKEVDYGTQLGNNLEAGKTEFLQRSKKISREQSFGNQQDFLAGSEYLKQNYYLAREARNDGNIDKTMNQLSRLVRRIRSAKQIHSQLTRNPLDSSKFVTQKKTSGQRVLSSMDVYERDLLRELIIRKSHKYVTENEKRKIEESKKEILKNYKRKQRKRFPRAAGKEKEILNKYVDLGKGNTTECKRHELYVDFQDIGLSNSIIAPKGYSAFYCRGNCDRLETHDGLTTNHANLRGVMYKMGLVRDFHIPCCVPTKLFSISILFFDDNENVVLKVYEDMVADHCGCR